MEIAPVSMTNLLNSILRLSDNGSTAESKQGSVVPATVLTRDGDSAVIQIMGVDLKVKLAADLYPGDKVYLFVSDNTGSGTVELKLLGKANPNKLAQPQAAQNSQPTSTTAARLAAQELQLSPGTLQQAAEALKQVPSTDNSNEVLAELLKAGIPIQPATYLAVEALLTGPELHEMLEKLVQSGNEFEQAEHAQTLPNNIKSALQQLQAMARQLLSEEQLPPDLNTKTNLLGINYEQQVARLLQQGSGESSQQWANFITLNGLTNLKQLLLMLNSNAGELSAAGLGQLTHTIHQLLECVTGIQLKSQSVNKNDFSYNFVALPLQLDGNKQTVYWQVLARKEAGRSGIDPANCYLVLSLTLPHLGEMDIHLNIINKTMSIRFVAERPAELSGLEQGELKDALSQQGFNLGSVKVERKRASGSRFPELSPAVAFPSIDTKI